MRAIVFDQHDVGKTVSGAGGELGLQLLLHRRLVEDLDVDGGVGMGGLVARERLFHRGPIEVGVPAPDSELLGRRSGNAEQAGAGHDRGKGARPPRSDAGHHSFSLFVCSSSERYLS